MNYEQDIKIDPDNLDVEWLNQPSLFMQYSKHLAQMRKEVDESRQDLDIKKAEVDRKIRENPEAYGIEGKVTEGAIQSAILTEEEFQDAQKKYLEVKYEMDMAQGAVNAFNQRKEALENLVKLHGMSYFAGPQMPRDLSFEATKFEDQKRSNRNIKTGLTREK
jgi:hypothetical protein